MLPILSTDRLTPLCAPVAVPPAKTATALPLRCTAPVLDALLLVRGPARITLGGACHLVDPLSALWCRGEEVRIRAVGELPVHFEWLSVERLAERAPETEAYLVATLESRKRLLLPLPPGLALAARFVLAGGPTEPPPLPARAWGPKAPGTSGDRSKDAGDREAAETRAVLVDRARELLGRSFRENRPVGRIASSLGCSAGHLSRTFGTATGTTLVAYRHGLRMQAALDRLDDDGSDLAALAHELGYASQSHFGARFERTFGVTPSAYRRCVRDLLTPRRDGTRRSGTR